MTIDQQKSSKPSGIDLIIWRQEALERFKQLSVGYIREMERELHQALRERRVNPPGN